MKFGDKLIKLRKGMGLSQEELAVKLNVSRQSVSKWESNNSYPETDKIIQICNIFKCSMDSLIDDNISEVIQTDQKSKNNFNIVIDSFLGFISKTINMFSQMKFISILKCAIEQIIIAIILFIISSIIIGIIPSTISQIFSFLPTDIYSFINMFLRGICKLLCFILSLIIIIHIFKIRYLDYYDNYLSQPAEENNKEKVDKTKKKEKISVSKEKETLVFRNPSHEPFAFLSIFSNIIIYIIKFCMCCLILFIMFILIFSIVGLVISIYLSIYSSVFLGTSILFAGSIILLIIIALISLYFILNRKINFKIMTILSFASIFFIGIGLGDSLIHIKDFKLEKNSRKDENITNIIYQENMLIRNYYYPHEYSMIIDNNIESNSIIVKNYYDNEIEQVDYDINYLYGMKELIFYNSSTENYITVFNRLLSDLKENTIRDYSNNAKSTNMQVIANEETILKLMDNFSKVYLYNKRPTSNGYIITDIEEKIEMDEIDCEGDYDVLENKVICPKWCRGTVEEKKKGNGTKIYFSCISD